MATESVCLKTGFCLQVESHMISDGSLVVQSGSGTMQFPVEQVESITALPNRPPKPASDLPPVPALTAQPHLERVAALKPVASHNVATTSEQVLLRAAIQEGLEPAFLRSVAMVESGLRQEVLSEKGAIGLMQLMPFTAVELGVDPNRMEQNALGGAAFLRQLLIKYKGDSLLALAAYNAGPGAVDKFKGVPPYLETRRYVVKVLQEYVRQQHLETEKTLQAGGGQPIKASADLTLQAERSKTKLDDRSTPQ